MCPALAGLELCQWFQEVLQDLSGKFKQWRVLLLRFINCSEVKGSISQSFGSNQFYLQNNLVLGIITCHSETAKRSVNKPEFVSGVGLELVSYHLSAGRWYAEVLQLFHKQTSY